MSKWVGLGSVRRTVDGVPDPDGRGSERLLKFLGVSITERVLAYEPPSAYRYHVTNGSPFICHHGEIRLRGRRLLRAAAGQQRAASSPPGAVLFATEPIALVP